MWRLFHSCAGIASLLLVTFLALTGIVMSTAPAVDAFGPYAQSAGDLTVAGTLKILAARYPEIDALEQTPSGAFVLQHRRGQVTVRDYVDVRTGQILGREKENPFYAFVKELHRSLRLGTAGRGVSGIGASCMLLLCLSGTVLLVRRFGGVKGIFGPVRGTGMERLHAITGRIALLPLLVVSLTGLYLTLIAFQLVPSGSETPPAYPESRQELKPVEAADLRGLQVIRLADIRTVLYPIPGDWFDVYAVETGRGHVFIDQYTGETLSTEAYGRPKVALDWITLIHTGEGGWMWGLVAGLFVMSVPVFAVSGLVIWVSRLRRHGKKVSANASSPTAEIVVLVGSETGTTWGFGRHLHERLIQAGKRVRLAAMNDIQASYPTAKHLILLTSTYGDGHAPKSANRFIAKVSAQSKGALPPFSVLGFGDKSFEHYCRFSLDTDRALTECRTPRFMEPVQIDRASSQAFTHWGRDLGSALGLALELNYAPPRPTTQAMELIDRADYGVGVGAPTAILRFKPSDGKIPRHVAGDLIGILPPGADVPRYYSLASNTKDGHIEICVRLMPNGLCSGHLHDLRPGATVDAYIRSNPDFHLPGRKAPVVMVGAGTGIAPFIGMIRSARGERPIELYWGGRAPDSDFLYETTTREMLETGRLSRFDAAFSRGDDPSYVQDRIRDNAEGLMARLKAGAFIMVCGGSAMADGVRREFDDITKRLGTDVGTLRRQRRYLEDIY